MRRNRPIAISLNGTPGVTTCHSCGRLTVSAGQKHHSPSCLVTRPCDRGSARCALATHTRPIINRGGTTKKRAGQARVRGRSSLPRESRYGRGGSVGVGSGGGGGGRPGGAGGAAGGGGGGAGGGGG